ncbi:hypothetical protein ACX6XY_07790 [Streptomyces sp. O3]
MASPTPKSPECDTCPLFNAYSS